MKTQSVERVSTSFSNAVMAVLSTVTYVQLIEGTHSQPKAKQSVKTI